jgi:hypothetical protein
MLDLGSSVPPHIQPPIAKVPRSMRDTPRLVPAMVASWIPIFAVDDHDDFYNTEV